jgi:hypothetical protein
MTIKPIFFNSRVFLGRENNFEKAQSSMIDSQGIGYDYRSVMHYSANAFSKNGQATIDPKVYFLHHFYA